MTLNIVLLVVFCAVMLAFAVWLDSLPEARYQHAEKKIMAVLLWVGIVGFIFGRVLR